MNNLLRTSCKTAHTKKRDWTAYLNLNLIRNSSQSSRTSCKPPHTKRRKCTVQFDCVAWSAPAFRETVISLGSVLTWASGALTHCWSAPPRTWRFQAWLMCWWISETKRNKLKCSIIHKNTEKELCRARKSHGTLQYKVRINVVAVQLFTLLPIYIYVCSIQKIHSSIVFYYTVQIIAQKYMLFHILGIRKFHILKMI